MSRISALISEIDRLKRILSEIPEDNVIERAAFEQRLDQASEEFERTQGQSEPERTRITFRGAPVDGSFGMKADFGGKATLAFSDAFAAIVAGTRARLKFMGPIPEKARTQLMISGTVTGSFGFEFTLPNLPADYFPTGEGAGGSLDTLFSVLKTSAEGDDDAVTDAITDLHPRAIKKVAEFLGVLAENQAWCSLEFRHRVFRFKNVEHLRSSMKRLGTDNIVKETQFQRGQFQGALPMQRTFEFSVAESKDVIRGRVGAGVEDVGVINRLYLHRPVRLKLLMVRVGQSRPRYTLQDLADISPMG